MKYAVIQNNMVTNVIVASPEQVTELSHTLGELVEANELRLQIGDMRVGTNWTRNEEGEQVILTARKLYSEVEAENVETKELLQDTELAQTDTEIALIEAELALTDYEIAEMEG